MKTQGAIIREVPGKYETAELELEEPRQGEITVKMVASGMCHTDDHIATGDMPFGMYPTCGGHEGVGVVVQVGPDTRGWSEGDHVVLSFLPACGKCRWCAHGMQNLCDRGANLMNGSRLDDADSFRMSLDGKPVGQMFGISTFSQYTTVDVDNAVKVPRAVPMESLCLLSCGVGTGWGSAVNQAGIYPGETVIVMGVGGIGMNAVQGAVHAGAGQVIAVDPVAFKREKAMEFGATHAVESIDEGAELARTFTNGQGADATIVTVGVTTPEHVSQAFASIRKAGTVVVTGVGDLSRTDLSLSPGEMTIFQKRLQGSLFGASNPTADIPWLVDLYTRGQLKLDELITHRYTLDQVAQGYEDMHAGKNIRGIVLYDD
ncbi:NDMA-dependent alcohol dehydrogenase [Georgenia sp. 10Sc9-8]|uniref:NDMA-dependent alcohol dehydrogenase n=1 Tax=Georgenia halotolerans TaxID=3028317 RepID=A0ABT5TZH0_9MICO|nr:NDMA-dependent alcohol dehydrogenase [Georgenia halotolerans]